MTKEMMIITNVFMESSIEAFLFIFGLKVRKVYKVLVSLGSYVTGTIGSEQIS